MTITINNLNYHLENARKIEGLVPFRFRFAPFRFSSDTPIVVPEEHPFYGLVTYLIVSTEKDVFPYVVSVLLNVTITQVSSFRIDDDCFEIEFFDGNIATFEIVSNDFSSITII